MRVLLVSNHGADRTYGGAERYVADLERELAARGHAPQLLSAFPIRDGSATRTRTLHRTDWREDPVRRYRNHLDDWLSRPWPRLGPLLRELAPDLVHTSNLPGIATGFWEQARRQGIPVVHTLHDYQLLCPRTTLVRPDGNPCRPSPVLCGARRRRLARWAGAVSVVLGVSSHVLGRHEGFFGAGTERRVIRPPLPHLHVGAPPQDPPATLGYLGVLRSFKGIDVLIRAAPGLARRGVRLRIAGHGPLASRVAGAPDVEFLGPLGSAEVPAFLASCDLGVVPSLWEEPGLTYSALDWLGAGRPVVATRHGGLAEIAARGGLESFDGTPEGLAEAVLSLQDADRWARLLATVPAADPAADRSRWIEAHLAAYEAALRPACR